MGRSHDRGREPDPCAVAGSPPRREHGPRLSARSRPRLPQGAQNGSRQYRSLCRKARQTDHRQSGSGGTPGKAARSDRRSAGPVSARDRVARARRDRQGNRSGARGGGGQHERDHRQDWRCHARRGGAPVGDACRRGRSQPGAGLQRDHCRFRHGDRAGRHIDLSGPTQPARATKRRPSCGRTISISKPPSTNGLPIFAKPTTRSSASPIS